ncbi:MAG TPA: glycosyltransferase 87 family protein [Candidatus Cybelea sp.]
MKRASARSVALGLLLLVLGVFAVRDFARLGEALPWRAMDDFPDFYCAGWVLDRGANPYTYEPLRTCEHRVNAGASFRGRLFAANPSLAIPAPQPPYDFPPYMLLARLPFTAARAVQAVAIVAAVAGAALALTALGIPFGVAAATLLLSTLYASLRTGQIVPFALLALVACGLALARRRDAWGGLFAALTAIEPTLGLPVAVATLALVPRARPTLLGALVLLAGVAVAVSGPHGTIAYLTRIIPAHASSETHFPFQYSFTYAAAWLGASDDVARIAGALSYLGLLGAGLWLGSATANRLKRRELLVFLPALCAVAGGSFVHQEELCLALPALAILSIQTRGWPRTISIAALCVVAVPWLAVWGTKQLLAASLFVCALTLWRMRVEMRTAVPIFVAIGAVLYGFELHPPQLPVPSGASLPIIAPGDLVQQAWQAYTAARSTPDLAWFAIKVPVWAALLAAIVAAAAASQPSAAGGVTPASISRRI